MVGSPGASTGNRLSNLGLNMPKQLLKQTPWSSMRSRRGFGVNSRGMSALDAMVGGTPQFGGPSSKPINLNSNKNPLGLNSNNPLGLKPLPKILQTGKNARQRRRRRRRRQRRRRARRKEKQMLEKV